jgi:D-alanyl-D-alanine carboxypeptidase
LNENYTPKTLSPIDSKFMAKNSKDDEFYDRALPFLQRLLNDAQGTYHIDINVLSAYRSFSTQANLKAQYKVVYGTGANTFSADQGYSEHQLGTALDFSTNKLGGLNGFEKTDAYTWLTNNAHRYGFILSYPPNNKFYVYEPWHWRFVGIELATKLHNDNKHFYDLDQREINGYLGNMFNGIDSIQ